MAVVIRVEADVKQAIAGLKRYQHKQVPYAVSRALNDTAQNVRLALIDEWNRSFTIRSKSLARAMWRIKFAKKTALRAEVYDRLERFFVMLQARGGQKTPYSNPALFIPTREVKLTGSGKISKRFKRESLKNTFIADLRGKGPALWQKQRNGRLKMLYVIEPDATIKKAFNLEGRAYAEVRKHFYGHMRRRLLDALATAK